VTFGMDIVLLELHGELFLFVDCEGLHSSTNPMNKKLSLITAMITQNLIWVTTLTNKHCQDDIVQICVNLKDGIKCGPTLPMHNLLLLANKSRIHIEARDDQLFLNNFSDDNKIKLGEIFAHSKLMYIENNYPQTEEEEIEQAQARNEIFENDMKMLVKHFLDNKKHFERDGTPHKFGKFVSHIEQVLKEINDKNRSIYFPNFKDELHKKKAEDVEQCMPKVDDTPFKHFVKQDEIKNKCDKIRNLKQIYNDQVPDRECIRAIRKKYFDKLDNKILEIETQNKYKLS
jgi:hypothetical protein